MGQDFFRAAETWPAREAASGTTCAARIAPQIDLWQFGNRRGTLRVRGKADCRAGKAV